jgi:outer membrane protein assembly factor BamB
MLALTAASDAARAAGDSPAAAARRTNYVGYHGPNGTQVYPGCNPPVEWDGKTGKNVLWQTPLPYVSYGGLIVVKDRVFLMSDFGYKSDFPELVCVDARDGRLLWQRAINHLAIAIPDEQERAKVAQAWHDHLAWRREYTTLKAELAAAEEAARAAVEEKMRAKGMVGPDPKTPPAGASPVSHWRLAKENPGIAKAGLFFDAWRNGFGGWWPGSTFATPCSDGQSVYVATAWRQYGCFDLDGNLKWLKWFAQGRGRGKGDSGDGCGANRSPLLWGDLFIADTFNFVRALDRRTGALKWEIDRATLGIGQHEVHSPVVITVGGVDVLWCNGPLAIRLADGKALKVEGWENPCMMSVVNADEPDTIYATGGGEHGGWVEKGNGPHPPPAAVKFTLAGETLKATVLWSGVEGAARPSNCATLAYHDGKVLYCNRVGVMLDPRTGKVLKGSAAPKSRSAGERAVPPTGSMYAIAGGRIYGSGTGGEHGCEKRKDDLEARLTMEVYSLDGKPLAVNSLQGPKLEGEYKAMNRAALIPNWFSYSMPFTVAGDRLYVRGCYMLYCIGARN